MAKAKTKKTIKSKTNRPSKIAKAKKPAKKPAVKTSSRTIQLKAELTAQWNRDRALCPTKRTIGQRLHQLAAAALQNFLEQFDDLRLTASPALSQ